MKQHQNPNEFTLTEYCFSVATRDLKRKGLILSLEEKDKLSVYIRELYESTHLAKR